MLVTPQEVAIESLRILIGELGVSNLIYNDFNKDFAGKVGQVVNARKPATFHADTFNNEVEVQDIEESTVPVKLDRLDDVTVPLSSIDKTLALKDFSKQIVEPAMKALAEKVERNVIATIVATAGSEIAASVNPDNLEDIAKLGEKLDDNLAPMGDRSLVLAVKHKYNYALTNNMSMVSYAGSSETLRNAILGRVYGFDTYMSQYAPKSTAAAAGNVKSYKVTGTKGNKWVAVTNTDGASSTIKKGDQFIVDNHIYKVAQDATASSNAISRLQIEEKFHATIGDPTSVIVVNKPISVAFHKDAAAFVIRPLEMPDGAVKGYVASANGLSVRVVFDYDLRHKQDLISFDILYGVSPLNKDLAVRLA